LDFEFLNGIDHWHECDLARFRLQNRDTVIQVFIRAWPAAIDPRQGGVRRQCDAGRQLRQRYKGSSVEWQIGDLVGIDDLTQIPGAVPQNRSVSSNGDTLIRRSDLQFKVEANALSRRHPNTFTNQTLEARSFYRHLVQPRLHWEYNVVPRRSRIRRHLGVGIYFCNA